MIKYCLLFLFNILLLNKILGQNKVLITGELKVNGAFSTPITFLTTQLTLNETHQTIIYSNSFLNPTITLPAPSGVTGRQYTIINHTSSTINISNYRTSQTNGNANIIAGNTVVSLISDGTEWRKSN